MTTIFGQFVVGPPGSGKSTYCKFICENLKQLGRNAMIINLDPANDCLIYKPYADISSLITVQSTMDKLNIGPNGATLICMEMLELNFAWLYDTIAESIIKEQEKLVKKKNETIKSETEENNELVIHKPYFIFDCPGQSELYTHHKALKNIIKKLTSRNQYFDLRLTCVNLCDAHYASDFSKYIGVLLNSLATMLNLELPHVNILSKVDLLEKNGKTQFKLDFYTEVMDLKYLLNSHEDDPFHKKYYKLTEKLIDIIEDNSLVSFLPLDITKPDLILQVLRLVDRANGYFVDDLDLAVLQTNPQLFEMASGRKFTPGQI